MSKDKKILAAILISIMMCIVFFAKVAVTGVHHWRLVDATYLYKLDCIKWNVELEHNFGEREEFTETLFRWWDWSDRQIMSSEDYTKVFPYIGRQTFSDSLSEYLG